MPGRYEEAGVGDQASALSAVVRHLSPTFAYMPEGEVVTAFGHYAAVIRLSDELSIAICTDGVGSKTAVAAALGRYETIGFDCMAMNVNDLICVGARPLAMVDYLGVSKLDPAAAEQVLAGLGAAAKEAEVSVPGGELAQLPGIIGGPDDDSAFDLVGAAIGILHAGDLCLGEDVKPGDVLIGLGSSGIHSNGLTLARKTLLDDSGMRLEDHVSELGRSLGEELLEPTTIYVRAAAAVRGAGVAPHGMAHITGDGLANLCRIGTGVDHVIDVLPEVPPIFRLIAAAGGIPEAEMYSVFNMGVGFVFVVEEQDVTATVAAVEAAGYSATRIGRVETGDGAVRLMKPALVGRLGGDAIFEEA